MGDLRGPAVPEKLSPLLICRRSTAQNLGAAAAT